MNIERVTLTEDGSVHVYFTGNSIPLCLERGASVVHRQLPGADEMVHLNKAGHSVLLARCTVG